MYTPHNFFEAPKDQATPTPRPHQDEAAELAHADRSPVAAFIAIAAALAAFGLLWFGRLLLVPSLCLGVAAVVAALLAGRSASLSRPWPWPWSRWSSSSSCGREVWPGTRLTSASTRRGQRCL